jgi:hypothetical protein
MDAGQPRAVWFDDSGSMLVEDCEGEWSSEPIKEPKEGEHE